MEMAAEGYGVKLTRRSFIASASAVAASRAAAAVSAAGRRFYKGQFHTHTYWSDGSAFPEQAVALYKDAGYDFLGLSDHNVYAAGERSKKVGKGHGEIRAEILESFRRTFPDCVETSTDEKGAVSVKLATMEKLRARFEQSGKFLLLDAVEATTNTNPVEGIVNQVHLNYLNVPGVADNLRGYAVKGVSVVQRIEIVRKSVEALARSLGREEMLILNHPIWRWYDVLAEDLIATPEVRFFEVCNGGSPYRPGKGLPADGYDTDRFWDVVNAFRARRGQPLLYGVGNDDTHEYFGMPGSAPGIHCLPFNAWSLVRADALTPEALLKAMKAGDFAACEGVQPEDFSFDAKTGTLSVSVAGAPRQCRQIQFIVTKKDFSETPVKTVDVMPEERPEAERAKDLRRVKVYDTKKIGVVAKSVSGGIGESVKGAYTLQPDDLYVRARILAPARPAAAAFLHPRLHVAWTQPYRA